jgi:ribosome-binding factor A
MPIWHSDAAATPARNIREALASVRRCARSSQTITSVDVDPELNRAIVFFDSLAGEEGDDDIVETLGEYRIKLQSSIARQIKAKKTPILSFRPDMVIRSAERIDTILRADRERDEYRSPEATD